MCEWSLPLPGEGVGGWGSFPLTCSAGAPQDQYQGYSHARHTPHNHHSAGAPWTVVGGYASIFPAHTPHYQLLRRRVVGGYASLPLALYPCVGQPLSGVEGTSLSGVDPACIRMCLLDIVDDELE